MTTQRQVHGVSFSECPECGATIGTRGMARHRKARHGVAPATSGAGRKTSGLTERQAKLYGQLSAGPVASTELVDIVARGLEAKGLARLTDQGWVAA